MFGITSSTVIPSYSNTYPDPDTYMATGVNKPAGNTSMFAYNVPTFDAAMAANSGAVPSTTSSNPGINTAIVVLVALGAVLLIAAVAAA